MRTQYWTCPLCGANLDFSETCDCRSKMAEREREKAEREKELAGMMTIEKSGQLRLAV